jgi:OmpA-OmpF porin, OOP family
MKKTFLISLFLIASSITYAQFGGLLDKAKKKVEDAGKKVEAPKEVKSDDKNTSVQATSDKPSSQNAAPAAPASLKTYSKYDFVPGEKIIVFEDFMQDAVGDFPAKWNTNSSGEVVTIEGKTGHWLKLTNKGFFVPEFIDSLPENFTLEYDLLCDYPVGSWGLFTNFVELTDRNKPEAWQSANNRISFNILPGANGNGYSDMDRRKAGTGEAANRNTTHQFADITKAVHVAFWRQKERMRLYLNEEKAWDIPKAILPEAKLNSLIFWVQLTDEKSHFIMSNLRVATGAPDTRNKILTQNKWVTHGILFDVNSDNIKAESYGTLKEMANVLKEFTDLKVKIVGHTDSDGDDAKNMDLSKRRAASVKASLAKEFSIDESRMETDGKGESEPIDKNDNPAGKANNRRVEFIKI